MNRKQKSLLINFIIVLVITVITVVGMINFKDWVNRKEATMAMEKLGKKILDYREKVGSVPPQSYVDQIKSNLQGQARLGNLKYRARWIEFGCPPDEILAYSKKEYNASIFGKGYIVLRFDGSVEWRQKKEFEELLTEQQSPMEIQMENR